MNRFGPVALAGFIGSIVAANLLIEHMGVIGVGFGLAAPAGVLAAGLAFTFRDLTHEAYGWRGAVVAIVAGAWLSWTLSAGVTLDGGLVSLALASGLAFLLSELADLGVYAPLRRRHWLGAVLASNVVGLLVDSGLFLLLAFGSLDLLAGQVVGKLYMTALAVVLLGAWRYRGRLAWA